MGICAKLAPALSMAPLSYGAELQAKHAQAEQLEGIADTLEKEIGEAGSSGVEAGGWEAGEPEAIERLKAAAAKARSDAQKLRAGARVSAGLQALINTGTEMLSPAHAQGVGRGRLGRLAKNFLVEGLLKEGVLEEGSAQVLTNAAEPLVTQGVNQPGLMDGVPVAVGTGLAAHTTHAGMMTAVTPGKTTTWTADASASEGAQIIGRVENGGFRGAGPLTSSATGAYSRSAAHELPKADREAGGVPLTAQSALGAESREIERAALDGKLTESERLGQVKTLLEASGTAGRKVVRDAARNYDPATGRSFRTTVLEALGSDPACLEGFKWGQYLAAHIGPAPPGMYDPHAHHILYKLRLGEEQQKLVAEGQAILRRAGIDPVFGLEVLVWAPKRVRAQHGPTALKEVVDSLREVEASGGEYRHFVKTLKQLGEIAASRNNR